METLAIVIFILGYVCIALEHSLKVDKLVPALFIMVAVWSIISIGHLPVFEVDTVVKKLIPTHMEEILLHHLGKTADILVFLIGAMTIVEIMDYFDAFGSIKRFFKTRSKKKVLWIFAILAFVLSGFINNLTSTIVLITILRKIVASEKDRLWYAGLIIIASNAGGAWSPIGDVTTTMLWIAGKVSALALVTNILIPSIACLVVPVLVASRYSVFKGEFESVDLGSDEAKNPNASLMLYLGLFSIVFVPAFQELTGMPPYMGIMLSLSVVAGVAEIITARQFKILEATEERDAHHKSPIHTSLAKIEMPSLLFFLGVLMAVAGLESLGTLYNFANGLTDATPLLGTEHGGTNISDLVPTILGIGSALVDNVPLVAASIGMFTAELNDPLWHFIAYSTGVGGSILIIGSAAGVVAMGLEKISFGWYLKNMSLLALIGFFAGIIAFIILRGFLV